MALCSFVCIISLTSRCRSADFVDVKPEPEDDDVQMLLSSTMVKGEGSVKVATDLGGMVLADEDDVTSEMVDMTADFDLSVSLLSRLADVMLID